MEIERFINWFNTSIKYYLLIHETSIVFIEKVFLFVGIFRNPFTKFMYFITLFKSVRNKNDMNCVSLIETLINEKIVEPNEFNNSLRKMLIVHQKQNVQTTLSILKVMISQCPFSASEENILAARLQDLVKVSFSKYFTIKELELFYLQNLTAFHRRSYAIRLMDRITTIVGESKISYRIATCVWYGVDFSELDYNTRSKVKTIVDKSDFHLDIVSSFPKSVLYHDLEMIIVDYLLDCPLIFYA